MPTLLSQIEIVAAFADRCDGCGAAAKLGFDLVTGGSLALCGHHANKHAAAVAGVARRIRVEEGFTWAAAASG